MEGLTRDDSEEIGFVISCLFSQAINLDEVKQWCYEIIRTRDEYPDYIFDVIDFSGAIAHLFRIIGFSPHSPVSEKDEEALYGIAYKRGVDIYDPPLDRKQALKRLQECPAVEQRFKETFREC